MGAGVCALLVGLLYAVLLVGGHLVRPADGRPSPPLEAAYAAFRLLVHPVGHVVSSGFLWYDALASTAFLLGMGACAVLLHGVAHPHVDPLYRGNALGLLIGAAVGRSGWRTRMRVRARRTARRCTRRRR